MGFTGALSCLNAKIQVRITTEPITDPHMMARGKCRGEFIAYCYVCC